MLCRAVSLEQQLNSSRPLCYLKQAAHRSRSCTRDSRQGVTMLQHTAKLPAAAALAMWMCSSRLIQGPCSSMGSVQPRAAVQLCSWAQLAVDAVCSAANSSSGNQQQQQQQRLGPDVAGPTPACKKVLSLQQEEVTAPPANAAEFDTNMGSTRGRAVTPTAALHRPGCDGALTWQWWRSCTIC